MTIDDPRNIPQELKEVIYRAIRQQIAWVNALRLELRNITDKENWDQEVGSYLRPEDYEYIMGRSNKVTQLGMLNG